MPDARRAPGRPGRVAVGGPKISALEQPEARGGEEPGVDGGPIDQMGGATRGWLDAGDRVAVEGIAVAHPGDPASSTGSCFSRWIRARSDSPSTYGMT